MSEREPRPFLIRAEEVMPFCLKGHDAGLRNRVRLSNERARARKIYWSTMSHSAPGQEMARHVHPRTTSCIICSKAWDSLTSVAVAGNSKKCEYPVSAGSAVFIPAGTYHRFSERYRAGCGVADDMATFAKTRQQPNLRWPHRPMGFFIPI